MINVEHLGRFCLILFTKCVKGYFIFTLQREVIVQSGSPGVCATVCDLTISAVNKFVFLILNETPRQFVAHGKDLIGAGFQTEHL